MTNPYSILGRAFARWRRLSAPERNALLEMMFVIPVAAASLRIAGLRRTLAALQPRGAHCPHPPRAIALARATLARVRRYAPYKGNCLSQSMALWRSLRRHGIEAQLQIGARVVNERLEAHAWVEYDGMPLNDVPDVANEYGARFDVASESRLTSLSS